MSMLQSHLLSIILSKLNIVDIENLRLASAFVNEQIDINSIRFLGKLKLQLTLQKTLSNSFEKKNYSLFDTYGPNLYSIKISNPQFLRLLNYKFAKITKLTYDSDILPKDLNKIKSIDSIKFEYNFVNLNRLFRFQFEEIADNLNHLKESARNMALLHFTKNLKSVKIYLSNVTPYYREWDFVNHLENVADLSLTSDYALDYLFMSLTLSNFNCLKLKCKILLEHFTF